MGVALVSRIRGESFFGDEKCASGGASGEAEEVPKKKNTFQKISHNFMDSLQNQAKKITTNIKIEICLFLFDTVRI
jgi:hypothetical protein